jgi:hypothetical protein
VSGPHFCCPYCGVALSLEPKADGNEFTAQCRACMRGFDIRATDKVGLLAVERPFHIAGGLRELAQLIDEGKLKPGGTIRVLRLGSSDAQPS